jgi:molybdopterin-binding protein
LVKPDFPVGASYAVNSAAHRLLTPRFPGDSAKAVENFRLTRSCKFDYLRLLSRCAAARCAQPLRTGRDVPGQRHNLSAEFRFRTCGGILLCVPHYRMSEIAELFGVSDDTVRRWADSGQLTAIRDAGGRKAVDGVELAAFAKSQAHATPDPSVVDRSARNRFVGLVTEVISDRVMAQVEIQCGPHRVVSLMSSEAARELGLVPGVLAVAVVKSTQVMVETPGGRA